MQFGMNAEPAKVRRITERFKDWAPDFVLEIHFAFGSVIEAQMEDKIGNVAGIENTWCHAITPEEQWISKPVGILPIPGPPAGHLYASGAIDDPSFDFHCHFKLSILCVVMRRSVITVEHRNDNSEEAANLWDATR